MDRPSGRSGTRSPSASNTRRSDSRDTGQDRYARNRRIRADAPCSPPRGGHDAIRGERRARRNGAGSDHYALVPLGATLSEFVEVNPSEIPLRTQSVSAFLFGKFSKGPRSFGKTLRDLSHPLMGNKRVRACWTRAVREQTSSPSEEVDKTRKLDGSPRHRQGRSKLQRLPKGEKHTLN